MTAQTMSRDIQVSHIERDPGQPRKHFDDVSLRELADSMEANGLIQPIIIRPDGERFVIVAGERRWRAAQLLEWETIPAQVMDIDAEGATWAALVENIQRADLSPIEEANAYRAMLDTGITQTELGERIGKGQSYIASKLRLLKMPKCLQLYLDRGLLTEGHIKQLLRIKGIYVEDVTGTLNKPSEYPTVGEAIADWEPEIVEMTTAVAFRPFDQPVGCLRAGTESGIECNHVHVDAILAFFDNDCDGLEFPVWVSVALWYAMLFVSCDVSVADASTSISAFRDHLYSVIWQNDMYSKDDPREIQWRLYWAVRSDLRHAGLDANNIPSELEVAAIKHLIKSESYAMPSQMQEGGEHYELAMEWRQRQYR